MPRRRSIAPGAVSSRRSRAVWWTESAARDLEEIARWISQDEPGAARRVLYKLRDRANSLRLVPERGRVVPELARMGVRRWRELLSGPYRIVYRVEEERVLVLAVFDARRDIEDELLERLIRDEPG